MLRALYILAYVSATGSVKTWHYDGLDCQTSNWVGEYNTVIVSCDSVTVGCTNNETENSSEEIFAAPPQVVVLTRISEVGTVSTFPIMGLVIWYS